MGILSFANKQFIDILQWTETGDDVLAWRFPTADFEIQQGSQLIVRETQAAVFVDQGHVADLFGPGTHNHQHAEPARPHRPETLGQGLRVAIQERGVLLLAAPASQPDVGHA
jgi:hypothetical protein